LNPKSRFKFIPEFIASRAPKCIKSNPSESVALIGRKMTERFLEKQFYSSFFLPKKQKNKNGFSSLGSWCHP